MSSQSIVSLALPELILGISALVLLVWGAFRGRADPALLIAAFVALLAAAFDRWLLEVDRVCVEKT